MKGHGLSVFRGTEPERFDVEVLGVLPGTGAGRSTIVVRVGGQDLEKSGVIAGMSGSPIYLDGRLAGALSSGWQFSTSPIAGVTPIAELAAVERTPLSGPTTSARTVSFPRIARLLGPVEGEGEELRLERLREAFAAWSVPGAAASGLLAPVTSSLPAAAATAHEVVSRLGLLPSVASDRVAPRRPIPSAGGPLVPGASITAILVDGDMRIGANGTVTWVGPDGRFLAFGHPFLALGDVDLAVSRARVVALLPSLAQSFKLTYPDGPPVWRLTRDREGGVAGRTDHPATMIPVRLRVSSAGYGTREMAFRIAGHPRLTAPLVSIVTDAGLTAADEGPRERTLRFRVTLGTNAGPVTLSEAVSGVRAKELAVLTTATLSGLVAENEFADPGLSSVDIDVDSAPGEQRLKVVGAALSSSRAAPGETLAVAVRLRDRRGSESVRTLHLEIPKNSPEGKASVVVGDGNSATAFRGASLAPGEPASFEELRAWVARIQPATHLWVGLTVLSRGAASAGGVVESLPGTAVSLLGDTAGRGTHSVDLRLLSESGADFDRPLAGLLRLDVEIERHRW